MRLVGLKLFDIFVVNSTTFCFDVLLHVQYFSNDLLYEANPVTNASYSQALRAIQYNKDFRIICLFMSFLSLRNLVLA